MKFTPTFQDVNPIKDNVFIQTHEKFKDSKSIEEYCKLTLSDGIDRLNLDQRETLFWDNIFKKRNIYGSEVEATLFDNNLKIFNMSHLNDPVSIERDLRDNRINGVNTPFLYVGSFGTSFAFHVEDYNLYSTSYLHVGDPKTWYIIPPRDGLKFERFAKRYLREYCEDAIQHKIFMPSAFAIKENGINFGKIRQGVGEFVVTFPYINTEGLIMDST